MRSHTLLLGLGSCLVGMLVVSCGGTGGDDGNGDLQSVVPTIHPGGSGSGGHAGKAGATGLGGSAGTIGKAGSSGSLGVSGGTGTGGSSGASGHGANAGTSSSAGSSGATGVGGHATGGTGGSGTSGQTGEGGGGSSAAGTGGSPLVASSCSPDLHTVLDQYGMPLTTCPPNEGCLNAQCASACAAASAASGSIGCDFYAPVQPFYDGAAMYNGSCYAAFVANTWGQPAKLMIERAGQSYDATQYAYIPNGTGPSITYQPLPATGLPVDQVAILFLAQAPGSNLKCPVPTAFSGDGAVHSSGSGTAFHITSDTPLSGYDIMPYGGASTVLPSASLLFPSTSWGLNYYAIAPRNVTQNGSNLTGRLWMLLVGSEDGTQVTVSAKNATLPGGAGIPQIPAGGSATLTLNAGQTAQWEDADPTGAIIQADKPVGLFSGTTYLCISSQTSPQGGGCDSAHQEVPQIKALGAEYVGPGIRTRLASGAPESIPYKMLGVIDGTTLEWEPSAPAGAPTSLNAGQSVEFETTELFVVKSQDDSHPFLLSEYMPGTPGNSGNTTIDGCGNGFPGCELGDDEWVMVLPPKQFLNHYVFFTDPTYASTNLVVTRVRGASGFSDVTIECIGTPITGWQDVGSDGTYQVAAVDLSVANVAVAQCATSRHEAKSDGNFGVTVWGTDEFASYAYPAGGSLASINQVVIKP